MRSKLYFLLFSILLSLSISGYISLAPGGRIDLAPAGKISLVFTPPAAPLKDDDVTATMTANNAPSPNVTSASGEFSGANAAWVAFDGNAGTNWIEGVGLPAWLKYDFGSTYANPIKKLRLLGRSGLASRNPNAFTLAGSNDDSSYTTIYTGNMVENDSWQEFTFTANTTAYRYYKLNVTSTFYGSYPQLAELELWEKE